MNRELREIKRLKRLIKKHNSQKEHDNFYTEESLNNYIKDDSISSREHAFMIGYLAPWTPYKFGASVFSSVLAKAYRTLVLRRGVTPSSAIF